ncbi:MAG: FHA domain-containing protein [Chloroflexota bacterium]
MILCPNCQHKEPPGTLFCSQCGAQLVVHTSGSNIKTNKINTAETRRDILLDTEPLKPSFETTSWISLHMLENGQILPLAERGEYTLGRSAEGQPIVPDVDLTPYNAYASGVSRLHAAIRRIETRVFVVDLGSSNGTYINGNRISPYTESSITHGDIIYLGKLKIQVLLGQG